MRSAAAVFDAECSSTAQAEARFAEFAQQRAEAIQDSLENWLCREGVGSVVEYVRRLQIPSCGCMADTLLLDGDSLAADKQGL